ncbi:MAG: segregation/condensation protein A [Rhodospirillum sp.]|nr:segregation/condensation protein A [Rhodospirillum sp.]MCF8490312.1 segregation/condensation protein A [Rhodospirillum sp.]MCF8500152.1 segregation/condensation protein A [Rhodospirillum sp.]
MVDESNFQEDPAPVSSPVSSSDRLDELVLELDGFEGPIDLLLTLARDQKVDLAKLSILALAEQYLTFMVHAQKAQLELAADYLVMAAWLAYLKSRLLLPAQKSEEEPSGEELAAALQFQLQRLEAMRRVSDRLMNRPRLGRDLFARGAPEGIGLIKRPIFAATLHDLLRAYGSVRGARDRPRVLEIEPFDLYSVDDAIQRISAMLGTVLDWTTLRAFLPPRMLDPLARRSALAATFVATLEMAKQGILSVRQDGGTYAPIHVKPTGKAPWREGDDD